MEVDKIGVHVTHCCRKHGCKYGKPDCPVAWGTEKQAHRCEYCDMDWEEQGEPECSAGSCDRPGYWKWHSVGVFNSSLTMISLRTVYFYLCDAHDAWHRTPEWKIASAPVDERYV